MSDSTPAPGVEPIVPTRPVKIARVLWFISFGFGFIAILFAFVSRNDQLLRLHELISGLAPERDAETVDTVAVIVFWGTLGLLALLMAVEAFALRVMMHRHGGARWALMVTLFINAAAMVIADALVIAPGDDGLYLRVCLVVQLASAGSGLVLSLVPSASAWFRAQKKPHRRPRG